MNDDDFNDILDDAEKEAQEKLKNQITALTKLTPEDLQKLAPSVADKNKLLSLIQIVKSATDDNNKKAQIISNIEMYAGIVLNIAGKFLL